jgi:hypothetical protein
VNSKPGLSLPNREWYARTSVPWPFTTEEHDSEYWELQLDTIPGWHDGSWLVTFIQEQQFRLGDFTDIKSDAG